MKANLSRSSASVHNTKNIVLVDTSSNTTVLSDTVKMMLKDLGRKSIGATASGFV